MKAKKLLPLTLLLVTICFAEDKVETVKIREQLAKELHCEATPQAIAKAIKKTMQNNTINIPILRR